MAEQHRITIRLSPALAARLATTTGPHHTLADTVRHALEAYLAGESAQRQPPGSHLADAADTLAAITTRLTHLEQRLMALEAAAAARQSPAASARQPPAAARPPARGTPNVDAAYHRMQQLQAEGLTLAQIAARLTQDGYLTQHGRPWSKSTVSYILRTHGR